MKSVEDPTEQVLADKTQDGEPYGYLQVFTRSRVEVVKVGEGELQGEGGRKPHCDTHPGFESGLAAGLHNYTRMRGVTVAAGGSVRGRMVSFNQRRTGSPPWIASA